MGIAQYLNESVVNESKSIASIYNRVKKYMTNENLNFDEKGFDFGKFGKYMFVNYHIAMVYDVFRDINFPELIKLPANENAGKKYIKNKKVDDKTDKFLMSQMANNYDHVNAIAKMVSWDANIYVEVMNKWFSEQGFSDIKLVGVED